MYRQPHLIIFSYNHFIKTIINEENPRWENNIGELRLLFAMLDQMNVSCIISPSKNPHHYGSTDKAVDDPITCSRKLTNTFTNLSEQRKIMPWILDNSQQSVIAQNCYGGESIEHVCCYYYARNANISIESCCYIVCNVSTNLALKDIQPIYENKSINDLMLRILEKTNLLEQAEAAIDQVMVGIHSFSADIAAQFKNRIRQAIKSRQEAIAEQTVPKSLFIQFIKALTPWRIQSSSRRAAFTHLHHALVTSRARNMSIANAKSYLVRVINISCMQTSCCFTKRNGTEKLLRLLNQPKYQPIRQLIKTDFVNAHDLSPYIDTMDVVATENTPLTVN